MLHHQVAGEGLHSACHEVDWDTKKQVPVIVTNIGVIVVKDVEGLFSDVYRQLVEDLQVQKL